MPKKPKGPRKTGLKDGKFYPCQRACVSTQSDPSDEEHYIEPIKLDLNADEAINKITKIISSMKRTKLLKREGNYLCFQFTTLLLRYKDDVEFLIDEKEKLIHFRSQSRLEGYDWNYNRKRMEKFRELYHKSI